MRRTGGSRPAKSSSRYHHGDLRNALVETALRVVAEEGLEALTLRELARRLGVSHSAPAHHFADKAALLREVAVTGFSLLAEAMARAAAAQAPRARLRALGRAYGRFAVGQPAFFRVMFGPYVAGQAEPDPRVLEAGGASFLVLARCIQELSSADAAEVERLTAAAWSLMHGAATLYVDGPLRFQLAGAATPASFEAWLDEAMGAFADGVAARATRSRG
jgi:AcrR family transcriptional regulator